MIFSVSYRSSYKEEADEIRCPFNQLGTIYKFIKEHAGKRYVIADASPEDHQRLVEQVDIVRKIVWDYTIECSSILHMKQLIREGYNAYIKYPISDWETLQSLVQLGASDVYIDSSLGFQLKAVYDLCTSIEHDTLIRISPTLSPNASILGLQPNSFFIRPEDLHLYEKYLGVIDFKITNQDKEDMLYKIYNRGNFVNDLGQLLEDCTFSVPNAFIKPEFGEARVNCRQHCMIPGHSCHLCDTQIQLTNMVYNYFKNKDTKEQGATKGAS